MTFARMIAYKGRGKVNAAADQAAGIMTFMVEPQVLRQWQEEFEAAAKRPLEQRMRYAFIRTYKPVLDDAPFRAFDTMEEYRQWCEKNLPDWLGYGRV